jgi:hypothetical protein
VQVRFLVDLPGVRIRPLAATLDHDGYGAKDAFEAAAKLDRVALVQLDAERDAVGNVRVGCAGWIGKGCDRWRKYPWRVGIGGADNSTCRLSDDSRVTFADADGLDQDWGLAAVLLIECPQRDIGIVVSVAEQRINELLNLIRVCGEF